MTVQVCPLGCEEIWIWYGVAVLMPDVKVTAPFVVTVVELAPLLLRVSEPVRPETVAAIV